MLLYCIMYDILVRYYKTDEMYSRQWWCRKYFRKYENNIQQSVIKTNLKRCNWLIILSNTHKYIHTFGSNFWAKEMMTKSCCSIFFTCFSSILIWWLLYNNDDDNNGTTGTPSLSQCIRCFDRKLHISITISKRRPGHKTLPPSF